MLSDVEDVRIFLRDPDFRLMMRKTIIDMIGREITKPEDDINKILFMLKGTGKKIFDIPDMLESLRIVHDILSNKDLKNDIVPDIDTSLVCDYLSSFLLLVEKNK